MKKTNDNILFHLSTVLATEEKLINKEMDINSNSNEQCQPVILNERLF